MCQKIFAAGAHLGCAICIEKLANGVNHQVTIDAATAQESPNATGSSRSLKELGSILRTWLGMSSVCAYLSPT
jgi:hypothetical protein